MKSKYRLAIVVSHPIQYYYGLYRQLARSDEIDPTVYYCWDGGTGNAVYDPTFKAEIKWDLPLLEGYRYRFLKNYSPNPFLPGVGFINPAIITELITNRYDAVFVWGYDQLTNWLAFLGAFLSRTPIFLGGSVVYRPERRIPNFIKKLILWPLFRKIPAFLSECERNAEHYRRFGARPERIFWNPAAVDNDYFRSRWKELRPRTGQIKADLGLDPDLPVILFLGRLNERKRVLDLLEAYRRIQGRVEASLVFVGEGEERKELTRRVEEYGLERVLIAGFKNQTELPLYFTIADLYVLPSRYDPSPRSVNEAMNFALPVIVTEEVGQAGDLVRPGENGYLVRLGDIDDMAEKMVRILDDPELMKKFSQNAYQTVDAWNYRTGVRAMLDALRSLPGSRDEGAE